MISALVGFFAFVFFLAYMLGMLNAHTALETGIEPKTFPVYRLIRKISVKPETFFLISAAISIAFLVIGGALYNYAGPGFGLAFFVLLAAAEIFYDYRKMKKMRTKRSEV